MENVVLIIHLLLALALIGVVLMQRSEGGGLGMGGGGGFVLGGMGLIPLPFGPSPASVHTDPHAGGEAAGISPVPRPAAAFHALPEMVIPLGNAVSSQYLRAKLFIEASPAAVELLRQAEPRVMDTLNIFLRAVDEQDLASVSVMESLRAEMLHRVRLATGIEGIHAVLIGELLLR